MTFSSSIVVCDHAQERTQHACPDPESGLRIIAKENCTIGNWRRLKRMSLDLKVLKSI